MKINPRLKGLGFRRELPDIRDFIFELVPRQIRTLPDSVDLRGHSDMPPIYDQGELGSCTAHAVGALCDFEAGIDAPYMPSRLFLYYVTRSLEGTVDIDAGATIRNTIKAANEFGVPQETDWPYLIEKFKNVPPNEVFDSATLHQALRYTKVKQSLYDIKACLADGNLIAFGTVVYDSFYDVTDKEPLLKFPQMHESVVGGHALTLVGYDDKEGYFIVRNSWGTEFGLEGYFYMPYNYVTDNQLSMDFWNISLVER